MSYSMLGMTDANAYRMVGGIAQPTNKTALANFKALQLELSRFTPLRVDGDIGPATVAAFKKASGQSFTASQIAEGVPANTLALKAAALTRSLPPAKSLPPSKPVVQANGTVKETNPEPFTADTFMSTASAFAVSPLGLAAGAAVLAAVIVLKRRKKSTAASTPALGSV
jgi:lysozyme family protein